MARDTDELRNEIEQTREALGERIEQLATRAERVVDVRYQIRARPWETVAAALTVGFLFGRIGSGAAHPPCGDAGARDVPGEPYAEPNAQ